MGYFKEEFKDNAVLGQIQEKEFGNYFEYRLNRGNTVQGTYGADRGFPYEIAIPDGSVRFAKILKTVAYIIVDEDEYGDPVVEKWSIRNWEY